MTDSGAGTKVAESSPLLVVNGVSRRFGPVQALTDVTLQVDRGTVVGLIGENGAGKSTLLNILSGVDRPDDGTVLLGGTVFTPKSYREATRAGVFRVFQDLSLIPSASVYENIYLAHEDRFQTGGVIRHDRMRRKAESVLARLGHARIDPTWKVWRFDYATRQVIEIVKCFALAELLGVDHPVILLDEPTAGLSRGEIDFFYELIGDIRQSAAVVFVSHRLGELRDLSDQLYVLKDGRVIGDRFEPGQYTDDQIRALMVGRERVSTEPDDAPVTARSNRDEALRVSALTWSPTFSDVTFCVRRGEIVGLAGLIGSGRSELALALFGALSDLDGAVHVHRKEVDLNRSSVASMIRRRVGYVPPDRAADGIMRDAPVTQNISLAAITSRYRGPLISLVSERSAARRWVDELRIKTRGVSAPVSTLSGGNAQKVVLGRWLEAGAEILLLDNPTAGIDVNAKREIYRILRSFAARGGAILLISNEMPELLGLSDRVLVMKEGRVVREFDLRDPESTVEEGNLLEHMV